MKTVAIIQARMGSTRLPGKVLADIAGKTMIERVVERTAAAQEVDEVVVATTTDSSDDVLVKKIESLDWCSVFRGPVDDVLSRYYESAYRHAAQIVVRVTADDPLKDPSIIDEAVRLLKHNSNLDYCSNTIEPSYPEGLDIEVFRFTALGRAHAESLLPSEREHVTPFIWKHREMFNLLNFRFERDLKDWRWTVDRPADLEFMRKIFSQFRDCPLVSYRKVISWLEEHPEIRKINTGILRNEGYLKSVEFEKK